MQSIGQIENHFFSHFRIQSRIITQNGGVGSQMLYMFETYGVGPTPISLDRYLVNKKYVLWNMYLPNVVAFHTLLSKHLTVIVITLN